MNVSVPAKSATNKELNSFVNHTAAVKTFAWTLSTVVSASQASNAPPRSVYAASIRETATRIGALTAAFRVKIARIWRYRLMNKGDS